MRLPAYLESDLEFPCFHPIFQTFSDEHLNDPPGDLARLLGAALGPAGIRPGQRVALAVGSRGLARLPDLVAAACRVLREAGTTPIIVPAMGSHGGATPEGQTQVLERLGVSQATCGAPVVSSLAARQVATVREEVPVYFAADALDCDHTICLNRVKPHTKFKGPVESGLLKMVAVGLGKHQGALAYHEWSLKHGFGDMTREMAQAAATHANLRLGLAVVENAHGQVLALEAVPADRMYEREVELLALAKAHFPRLPVAELDVLVIRRIGKEISGSGMDPNVSGRCYDLMESDFSDCLKATRVVLLGLTAKTAGNGIGLGNADIITERLFRELDYEATLINALTSRSLRKAFIPVRLPSERKAIQAGFTTLGPVAPARVRAAIIHSTKELGTFWASAALAAELEGRAGISLGPGQPLTFNEAGDLCFTDLDRH